jgi:hypothetical protein
MLLNQNETEEFAKIINKNEEFMFIYLTNKKLIQNLAYLKKSKNKPSKILLEIYKNKKSENERIDFLICFTLVDLCIKAKGACDSVKIICLPEFFNNSDHSENLIFYTNILKKNDINKIIDAMKKVKDVKGYQFIEDKSKYTVMPNFRIHNLDINLKKNLYTM